MEEVTGHQGEGVLQHPQDHLLGKDSCGFDYNYLASLDEWLYIFVVACLKENLIGGRKKLFEYL